MSNSDRIWLEVSYAEHDAAKAAGARWDHVLGAWYTPRPGMTELQHWEGRPPLPDVLPGEDRSFGDGLFVDLVPDGLRLATPTSPEFADFLVPHCSSPGEASRLRGARG